MSSVFEILTYELSRDIPGVKLHPAKLTKKTEEQAKFNMLLMKLACEKLETYFSFHLPDSLKDEAKDALLQALAAATRLGGIGTVSEQSTAFAHSQKAGMMRASREPSILERQQSLDAAIESARATLYEKAVADGIPARIKRYEKLTPSVEFADAIRDEVRAQLKMSKKKDKYPSNSQIKQRIAYVLNSGNS